MDCASDSAAAILARWFFGFDLWKAAVLYASLDGPMCHLTAALGVSITLCALVEYIVTKFSTAVAADTDWIDLRFIVNFRA
jgi:hypothetical protein